MKNKTLFVVITLLIGCSTFAQSNIPEGFVAGKIILSNGAVVSGYLKDNIRKKSSIVFYNPVNKKKEILDANTLTEASFTDSKYLCLYGDFFKVITPGEHAILVKSSDASGKLYYNGVEMIINKGTDGKIDDRFEYTANTNELKPIRKKG
ncbi:MAG TPA: hypothetical protein VJ552_03480 [Sediminibacterium sp.]|nr:hypothetical protein [Sediminibacterium sp.]